MTLLSAPQQAELEKTVTRVVYFVEMQFTTGTQRLSSFNRTINWGGYDWSGLGQILRIEKVSESEGSDPKALTFAIAAAQASWLAVAVGPVEEYRGKPIKMYMCPMDESYVLIGLPVLCWRGIMDTAIINISGDEGGVQIKCETSAYALKRRPIFRINAAQHKMRYPGETGMDYLDDLIATPQRWLSRKFQAR